jgi:cell wall assembly regulator SMI1
MTAEDLFGRYLDWLQANVPAAFENLAPPATDADLAELERVIDNALPHDLEAVLRRHNGQKVTMTVRNIVKATPCLPTLSFLSTAEIAIAWKEWDDVRRKTAAAELQALQNIGRAFPSADGKVKKLYTSPGWIPLWADPARADFIGADLDPEADGQRGQIINFGRDEQRHYLAAPSFTALLAILVEEVSSGAWPASEMAYGQDKIPWFGKRGSHFFNALYARAESAAKTAR